MDINICQTELPVWWIVEVECHNDAHSRDLNDAHSRDLNDAHSRDLNDAHSIDLNDAHSRDLLVLHFDHLIIGCVSQGFCSSNVCDSNTVEYGSFRMRHHS